MTTAIDLTVWVELFFTSIMPILATYVAIILKKNHNITVEQKHHDVLLNALEQGAKYALDHYDGNFDRKFTVEIDNPKIAKVVSYVTHHVPDAIAYLNKSDDDLATMAISRLHNNEQTQKQIVDSKTTNFDLY